MTNERGSLEPYIKDEVQYRPWQLVGIRDLAYRHSFLLADDMGLGKSLQALTVFGIDVHMGLAHSCIIVCPPTLIGNWCHEIVKHTRFKYMVLDGTPAKRAGILSEFADIVEPKILVTNYEKIVKHVKELNALRFDAGIFDEAHYIKGHKSQRTKACHALVNGRSMLLTGTPMLGHVSDLWGLLHKIDPNETPKYWTFVNRYAVFGGYRDKQIVGVKNEKELRAKLEKVMLRRLAKDHLGLEEPFIVKRRVELTTEQRKLYNKMASDLKVPRPGEVDDEAIDNALVKFTRLKQVCANTKAFNGEDSSPKLDLCLDDDRELIENGEKIIVFTQFREMVQCYVERHRATYGDSVPVFQLHGDVPRDARQPIVDQWSNVRGPAVIVCMLQVAGVGLNMVASHNIAFLDKLFVPGLNRQAISRAQRVGQTLPVTVREYICLDTIENRVETIIKTKDKLFGEIVENSPDWKREMLKALIEQGRVA